MPLRLVAISRERRAVTSPLNPRASAMPALPIGPAQGAGVVCRSRAVAQFSSAQKGDPHVAHASVAARVSQAAHHDGGGGLAAMPAARTWGSACLPSTHPPTLSLSSPPPWLAIARPTKKTASPRAPTLLATRTPSFTQSAGLPPPLKNECDSRPSSGSNAARARGEPRNEERESGLREEERSDRPTRRRRRCHTTTVATIPSRLRGRVPHAARSWNAVARAEAAGAATIARRTAKGQIGKRTSPTASSCVAAPAWHRSRYRGLCYGSRNRSSTPRPHVQRDARRYTPRC